MSAKKNKIFLDLDGTLLDVSQRNYEVYRKITLDMKGIPMEKEVYWDLKRKKTKWPVLLPESQLDPSTEKEFLARFIPLIESTDYLKLDRLFPGALDTVVQLSREAECYLVSLRRNHNNLLEELTWLGLMPYFKEVLSGHSESDGFDKKIELITSVSGGDGHRFIIGDTEADIVTGQHLGFTTIGVMSGIRDQQFLEALRPDYLVDSITDVSQLPLFKN